MTRPDLLSTHFALRPITDAERARLLELRRKPAPSAYCEECGGDGCGECRWSGWRHWERGS